VLLVPLQAELHALATALKADLKRRLEAQSAVSDSVL
jgi:hypothetical protein